MDEQFLRIMGWKKKTPKPNFKMKGASLYKLIARPDASTSELSFLNTPPHDKY
jgi:hypothetical protein